MALFRRATAGAMAIEMGGGGGGGGGGHTAEADCFPDIRCCSCAILEWLASFRLAWDLSRKRTEWIWVKFRILCTYHSELIFYEISDSMHVKPYNS